MNQPDYKYDVALSFAGEQRDQAKQLATVLDQLGLRVFFDEFEQSNLWGKDLGEYLSDTYLERARFCVMFISTAYGTKMWPVFERRQAIARSIASKSEYVLPIRFDQTEVPGLPHTVSSLQWTTADDIAQAILSKLGLPCELPNVRVSDGDGSVPFDAQFSNISRYSNYNIAVLGKAGTGKSTLINYLFDRDIMNTGVGRSVTAMGFHKASMILGGIPVTVFDSGGLEIANLAEWRRLLKKELELRASTSRPEDWFHSILYCISAGGSRIDDFERDLIRDLVKEDQRVIVVFTKSDQTDKKDTTVLRELILAAAGKLIPCVRVCSVPRTFDNGVVVDRYGISELKANIVEGCWESISTRLPKRCAFLIKKNIDNWADGQKRWIDDNIGYFNKDVGVEHITANFESYLSQLKSTSITEMVSDEVTRTMNMFGAISTMFGLNRRSQEGSYWSGEIGDITIEAKETLMTGLMEIFINIVSIGSVFVPAFLFRGAMNRSDLRDYVDKLRTGLQKIIDENEPQIAALIDRLVRVR